jgi:hypothetical protein
MTLAWTVPFAIAAAAGAAFIALARGVLQEALPRLQLQKAAIELCAGEIRNVSRHAKVVSAELTDMLSGIGPQLPPTPTEWEKKKYGQLSLPTDLSVISYSRTVELLRELQIYVRNTDIDISRIDKDALSSPAGITGYISLLKDRMGVTISLCDNLLSHFDQVGFLDPWKILLRNAKERLRGGGAT